MKDVMDMSEAELDKELSKYLDESSSSSSSPTHISKDTQFKFWREILLSRDSRKIGFLKNEELGMLKLPVRNYLHLAKFAEIHGLYDIESYLTCMAEITTSTSMSRDGFFLKNIITQIKKEDKGEKKEHKKKTFMGIPIGGKNE